MKLRDTAKRRCESQAGQNWCRIRPFWQSSLWCRRHGRGGQGRRLGL